MTQGEGSDARWLDAAVRFARPYLGTTGAKPPVGTLIVDEDLGLVVGRALGIEAALQEGQGSALGRTLYLTLEPSPEEAELIIEAAPSRVVIGTALPERRGRGSSRAPLDEAGVDVIVLDHRASADHHAAFLQRLARNRPLTTLCLAISTDGMIGRRDGVPTDLMGEAARRWLGAQRAFSDGVMIGARTAELDDPTLDPVLPGFEDRPYVRIVLVGTRAPPAGLRLLRGGHPTWIVAESSRAFGLPPPVQFVTVEGRNDRPDLRKAMTTLAGRGLSSLLVEGGARLTEAMLAGELADRFHLIETAVDIGRAGLPATALGSIHGWLRAAGFVEVANTELGPDRLRTYDRQF